MIAKGEEEDQKEEALAYFGPHPSFMRARIEKHGGLTALIPKKIKVFGRKADYSAEFLLQVKAEMEWIEDESLLLKEKPEGVVLLRSLSPLSKLFSLGKFYSLVPSRMRSPQARDWPPEFIALLRFSERGVRLEDKSGAYK